MFEEATRLKLRFDTANGQLSVEDLWDIPLTGRRLSLDNIAKDLHKQLKEQEETSFVSKKPSKSARLELKFNIVKHIIDVKLAEREAAEQRQVNEERKRRIQEAIANKEDENLQGMSLDELKKELEQLQ